MVAYCQIYAHSFKACWSQNVNEQINQNDVKRFACTHFYK
ncbi:hypothetical protein PAUR_a1263 [Pseudoalteromonas aurantia 208]|uniref:Orphan protein n=1 Tax=Pseudoalteromonas aurantia 208 TaxID=1314867 RepID=A0ABR9EA10_9GAMM|nr:hypothetical protein [Pseudoalteromonas aurantia 208]